MPNYVKLALYASGLIAVGYLAYTITGDPYVTGALVVFARWVKPFA